MAFYRCSAEKEPETRMWDGYLHRFLEKYESLIITSANHHLPVNQFSGNSLFDSYRNENNGYYPAVTYISPWTNASTITNRIFIAVDGIAYRHSDFYELYIALGYDPIITFSEVYYDMIDRCIKETQTDSYRLRNITSGSANDPIKIPFAPNRRNGVVYSATSQNQNDIFLYEKVELTNGFDFSAADSQFTAKAPKLVSDFKELLNCHLYMATN